MSGEEEIQPDSPQLTQEGTNTPGGPVSEISHPKPGEYNDDFYDPLYPPTLIQTPDGKGKYIGGKRLDKDIAYSMKFWSRDRASGLRQAMEESLDSAIKSGEFGSFVGATKGPDGKVELEEESKEKLSAYRVLAQERGYTIGPYKYHERAGTVTATIGKTLIVSK